MSTEPVGKQFKCEQCHYSTNRSFDLRRHMQRHLKVKPDGLTQCTECSFTTKWKRNLRRHMQIHAKSYHPEEPKEEVIEEIVVELLEPEIQPDPEPEPDPDEIVCIGADNFAEDAEDVICTPAMNRVKIFVCSQCQYTTNRAFDLRRHEQTHKKHKVVEGTAYKCIKCPFISKWKRNMRRHIKRHPDLYDESKMYDSESQSSTEELVVELVEQEGINLYDEYDSDSTDNPYSEYSERQESPTLGKQPTDYSTADEFPTPVPVKIHQPTTNSEKRFKCNQCHYETKRSFDLRRHEQRHFRIKTVDGDSFKCPECPFVTKWRRNMNRHVLKHKQRAGTDSSQTNGSLDELVVKKLSSDIIEEKSVQPRAKNIVQIEVLDTRKVEKDLESQMIEILESEPEDSEVLPTYWQAINRDENCIYLI